MFWAAVEDCLVTFHNVKRDAAAGMVTSLWPRLPKSIACNLAEQDLPIAPQQAEYESVLKRYNLA